MLLNSGWKGPLDAEMFEKGRLCDPEARMEYQNNKKMNLEIDYLAESHLIMLSIYGKFGEAMDIGIYFEDKLQELIEIIISFQDEISSSNYKEYLRRILKIFPFNTYIARGEGFVQLTDKEVDHNVEDRDDSTTVE
jgi:hypothetical protein